ncbi:sensor histidine kinase [Nakamurella lactea]|uniref:sensor histidine kinase n=1 Tax=Nakamurella lactea TaxID=459515 RepID=UPI0004146EB9|nr:ATP-binding protein [Nakamurella lactea]
MFTLYACGLACWLALGLLPTLATVWPVFRTTLESLASGGSPVAAAAGRILRPDPDMAAVPASQALLQYGFSLLNGGLGVLLAIRRPDATVPRLLAFALVGTAATFNEPSHRAFHITGSPWSIALLHFIFHIVSGLCYVWAVLLFPDGRLPGRFGLSAAARRATALGVTVGVAVICWRSSFLSHPQFFVVFFGIGVSLIGVASAVLRLRDPDTGPADAAAARLMCAALLPALALSLFWSVAAVASRVGETSAAAADTAQNLFPVVFAIVPLVLSAAVVRYRLWDIDRLLGRVLVYGTLAAAISAGYVLAVTIGAQFAGGGLWWSVLVLSATAVAMEPLRRAAGSWANRVVYGQRISPSEAMSQLLTGLQQFSAVGGLEQVAEVAVAATRVSSAVLYASDGGRLVPVSAAPAPDDRAKVRVQASVHGSAGAGELPTGAALTKLLDADAAVEIRYRGMTLGALAVEAAEPLSTTDRRLLADLADHAGLLLHNSLLVQRLAAHVDELAALAPRLRGARRALIAAHDAERQRLERNLHDGAQQHLVAALIALQAPDPAATRSLLTAARREIAALSIGSRPSALAGGLAAAVRRNAALIGSSGATVRVDVDLAGLAGADPAALSAAEDACYFCCTEALQNVAKHAGPCTVTVRLDCADGDLRFSVTDDGPGIDPRSAGTGGGLAALAQRVGRIGGWIAVESAAARGTRIVGQLPVRGTAGSR